MIGSANSFDTNLDNSESVDDMALLCASRNACVMSCYKDGNKSLEQFLDLQASKVRANMEKTPLRSQQDFQESAASLAAARLGEQVGKEVLSALKAGSISTADHHGSIFCSQSFQGDILQGFLLRKLGVTGKYVPIITGGQIELGNVTYARGISLYTSSDSKRTLPFFRKLDHNQMALRASAINMEMLDKFRRKFVEDNANTLEKETIRDILETIYETEEVQACKDFAWQTTVIGKKLTEKLFPEEDGFTLVYLEVERVIKEILIKELLDENSILYRILFCPNDRKLARETTTEGGLSIASQLFVGADSKGRKIFLALSEDGKLSGETMDGNRVCYQVEPGVIAELIEKEEIYPGLLTAAILLSFERGITWMGGMFQASYLPAWKRCFARLLREMGLEKEAEQVGAYDFSGYISGPMYALYGGDNYATCAGPVEMLMAGCSFSKISELVESTSVWQAHIVGLHEMYPDLTSKSERPVNWYESVARELYDRCKENIIGGKSAEGCLG